jgi:hypothetical protein
MARSIGSILTIAGTAALIATGVGAIGAPLLVGIGGSASIFGIGTTALLTASAALTAAGNFLSGLGRRAPRPETTETGIKSPLPPRVDAFGISRLPGSRVTHP